MSALGPGFLELVDFSNAVQQWTWDESEAQRRPMTVGDAADHFRCEPREIIRAVRSHYWMYLELPGGGLAEPGACDTDVDAPITFDEPRRLVIGHEGE